MKNLIQSYDLRFLFYFQLNGRFKETFCYDQTFLYQKLSAKAEIARAEIAINPVARPSTMSQIIGVGPEYPLKSGAVHCLVRYILQPTKTFKGLPALIGMSDKLVQKSLLKAHVSVPSFRLSFVAIEEFSSTQIHGCDGVCSLCNSLSGLPGAYCSVLVPEYPLGQSTFKSMVSINALLYSIEQLQDSYQVEFSSVFISSTIQIHCMYR